MNQDRALCVLVGILICIAFISCVSATFPYKYYPYDISAHKLIGANPSDDLDDLVCQPKEGDLRPCMIVLTDEFFSLKSDYLKTKESLIKCERK